MKKVRPKSASRRECFRKAFYQTDIPSVATEPQGIFGIPLSMSIRYANVAISLCDNEGKTYIYGYVPIIVAKCGVFLKEMGKSIESSVQTLQTANPKQSYRRRGYLSAKWIGETHQGASRSLQFT